MDKGKLVGIVTESDIVRFLIHVLGIDGEGLRIEIEGLGEKLGGLENIISIINQNNALILNMIVLPWRKKGDWMIALRLNTNDPKTIIQSLKKEGFNVTWVAATQKEGRGKGDVGSKAT